MALFAQPTQDCARNPLCKHSGSPAYLQSVGKYAEAAIADYMVKETKAAVRAGHDLLEQLDISDEKKQGEMANRCFVCDDHFLFLCAEITGNLTNCPLQKVTACVGLEEKYEADPAAAEEACSNSFTIRKGEGKDAQIKYRACEWMPQGYMQLANGTYIPNDVFACAAKRKITSFDSTEGTEEIEPVYCFGEATFFMNGTMRSIEFDVRKSTPSRPDYPAKYSHDGTVLGQSTWNLPGQKPFPIHAVLPTQDIRTQTKTLLPLPVTGPAAEGWTKLSDMDNVEDNAKDL